MVTQYYTHKGVNQPPYFKGFPMSLIIVWAVTLLVTMLVCLIIAIKIGHLLVGSLFSIITVACVGFFTFIFLRKIGPFGYEKMLVKYFYRVHKIAGGRPAITKIRLF